MLFFCHSYSFYVLNTQTIAKWKKTCNLGDMYSYWANSTVNSSDVAGNHRSWKIYLSQKSGTTKGLFLEHHWLFLCAVTYLLTCLSQSLMSPINTPSMMGDGDECLQSCMMWLCGNNQLHSTVFKGTLNKHWNTERTTSAIKRKMVSSKWYL